MKNLKLFLGIALIIPTYVMIFYIKQVGVGLFLMTFSIAWIGGSLLISYISGWDYLISKFKTNQAPPNQISWMCTAQINHIRFRNCLNIGVNQQGLYLSVFPLFRIGNPPLFIPWIYITDITKIKYFSQDYYQFKIDHIILKLPLSALKSLEI